MEQPKVQPTNNNTYILLEDYEFQSIVVPRGYETNGADVPRIFWTIIPPFKPKFLAAIIVHDYLSELGDWRFADSVFELMLLNVEDSLIIRTMATAVKLHTWWWEQKLKLFVSFAS